MSNQQANSLLFKYKLFSKFFLEYKLETFVVNENVRLQIRYRSQGKDTRPKVERTFIILLACSEVNFIICHRDAGTERAGRLTPSQI